MHFPSYVEQYNNVNGKVIMNIDTRVVAVVYTLFIVPDVVSP